jgi:hypothetical protein
MEGIRVTGQVTADHQLVARVPSSVPPGEVTILVLPSAEEGITEGEWMAAVAREWEEELADARQDIYTLADGEPLDES